MMEWFYANTNMIFNVVMALVSTLTYWLGHYFGHALPSERGTFKLFLHWGYKARWNMLLVFAGIFTLMVLTAPK